MRTPVTASFAGVLVLCLLAVGTLPAQAASMKHRNVVDLISLSELILLGKVISVTDGFENGIPYTEVTLEVGRTLKGTAGNIYTFRQFGLRVPRDMGNGVTYVGVTPDGWPRFRAGERVVLFLYKPASMTGLRTTVGLFQGKFMEVDGKMANGVGNLGLFQNISVDRRGLTPEELEMFTMKKGAVRTDTFVDFVGRAVQQRWIEERKLDHVK